MREEPTKKQGNINKVKCFNYNKMGHFVKDYLKVKQDLEQGGFVMKTNVAKLGLT